MAHSELRAIYNNKSIFVILLVIALCVIGLFALKDNYLSVQSLLPQTVVQSVLETLLGGVIFIEIVSLGIYFFMSAGINKAEAKTLADLFRIIAYLVLILVLLLVAGEGQLLGTILVGAGFLGIVLGLAAQSTLSNFISGIYLLASKALEPDDNVIIHTWQYTMQAQSYPHDKFVPGFSGRIESIGVLYTKMINTEGVPVYVPNSIVAQALVINYRRAKEHSVRVQFDVDLDVPFKEVERVIKKAMGKFDVEKYDIDVEYLHTNLYVVTLHIKLPIEEVRDMKSELFVELIAFLNTGRYRRKIRAKVE